MFAQHADSEFTLLAIDDGNVNGRPNPRSAAARRIESFTVPDSGPYFVRASDFRYFTDTDYSLEIQAFRGQGTENDGDANAFVSSNDLIAHATPIRYQGGDQRNEASVGGTLHNEGDVDFFALGRFDVGQSILLDASSTPVWSTASVELGLYRADADGGNASLISAIASDQLNANIDQTGHYFARINTAVSNTAVSNEAGSSEPDDSQIGVDAQYTLNVSVEDAVAPLIIGYQQIPAQEQSTSHRISLFGINFSEHIDHSSLNLDEIELRGAGPDAVFEYENQLQLSFNRAISPEDLARGNVSVTWEGSDGVFGTDDDHAYDYRLSQPSRALDYLSLLLQDRVFDDGRHRFVLADPQAMIHPNGLDGNGDSIVGDAFTFEFLIDSVPDDAVAETQNNGVPSLANTITLYDDGGTTGWAISDTFHGNLTSEQDDDWWTFDAEAGNRLSIVAPGQPGHKYITPRLYSQDSVTSELTLLASGSTSLFHFNTLSDISLPIDGTYFLRFGPGAFPSVVSAPYSFQLHVQRNHPIYLGLDDINPTQVDFQDQGESRTASIAGTLEPVVSIPFHHDTFSIGTVEAGTTVSLSIDTPEWNTLRSIARITNLDGGTSTTAEFHSAHSVLSFEALTTGTLHLEIAPITGSGFETQYFENQYTARVQLSDTSLLPDLSATIDDSSIPDYADPRETIGISWNTQLIGDRDFSGTVVEGIYVSQRVDGYDRERVATYDETLELAVGQSRTRSSEISLPNNSEPGLYHVLIQTDVNNDVFEASEANQLDASRSIIVGQLLSPNVPGESVVLDANDTDSLFDYFIQEDDSDVVFRGEWTASTPHLEGEKFLHRVSNGTRDFVFQSERAWHNPVNSNDVDHDGSVSPIDALRVLNFLDGREGSSPTLPDVPASLGEHNYFDTSGDGNATPLDALRVINYLQVQQEEGERVENALGAGHSFMAGQPRKESDGDDERENHLEPNLF